MPGETLISGVFFVGWANPNDGSDMTGLTTGGLALTRVTQDDPAEWDARRVVDPTEATPLTLAAALALLCDEHCDHQRAKGGVSDALAQAREQGRRQAETEAQQRLDALVADAHEWAEEHELCERFDRFCREHGLREREYDVTVRVTLSVPVSLTLPSTDDVEDTFTSTYDEDDIWRMWLVRGRGRSGDMIVA